MITTPAGPFFEALNTAAVRNPELEDLLRRDAETYWQNTAGTAPVANSTEIEQAIEPATRERLRILGYIE